MLFGDTKTKHRGNCSAAHCVSSSNIAKTKGVFFVNMYFFLIHMSFLVIRT